MGSEDSYDEVIERLTAVTPNVDATISEALTDRIRVAEADGQDSPSVLERVSPEESPPEKTAEKAAAPSEKRQPGGRLVRRAGKA